MYRYIWPYKYPDILEYDIAITYFGVIRTAVASSMLASSSANRTVYCTVPLEFHGVVLYAVHVFGIAIPVPVAWIGIGIGIGMHFHQNWLASTQVAIAVAPFLACYVCSKHGRVHMRVYMSCTG